MTGMTKPKLPPKSPQQLADEHWPFIESVIFTVMKVAVLLFKAGMVHGYKHGKEDTLNGLRTRPILRDSCKDCLIRTEEHRCPGVGPKHRCLNDGNLPKENALNGLRSNTHKK